MSNSLPTPSANGQAASSKRRTPSPIRTPESVAFLDAQASPQQRGTVNASWTHQVDTAQDDATLNLFIDSVDYLYSQRPPSGIDADRLSPDLLGRLAAQRLQAQPELTELASHDLSARQRVLRDLSSGRHTHLARILKDTADQTVNDGIDALRTAVGETLDRAPHGIADQAQKLSSALQSLTFPEPDTAALRQFFSLQQARQLLDADKSGLSRKLRETVGTTVTQRALAAFERSIAALSQQAVNDATREAVRTFLPYLDELRVGAGRLRTKLADVRKLLEDARTQAHHQRATGDMSVQVILPGPDEAALVAGMLSRLRCADRSQLIKALLQHWELELNELAIKRYPVIHSPARFGTLLTFIDANDLAGSFRTLVSASSGELNSIYGAVHANGIVTTALQLYERAAVLVSFSSRDHENLNITPMEQVIVRLPPPVGPNDAQIKEDLMAAFARLDEHCMFVAAAPGERAITVVRTLVGFPIAVEGANRGMLFNYADSASINHVPHLFGLLPGLSGGSPLPAYLSLAEQLRTKGPQL